MPLKKVHKLAVVWLCFHFSIIFATLNSKCRIMYLRQVYVGLCSSKFALKSKLSWILTKNNILLCQIAYQLHFAKRVVVKQALMTYFLTHLTSPPLYKYETIKSCFKAMIKDTHSKYYKHLIKAAQHRHMGR